MQEVASSSHESQVPIHNDHVAAVRKLVIGRKTVGLNPKVNLNNLRYRKINKVKAKLQLQKVDANGSFSASGEPQHVNTQCCS